MTGEYVYMMVSNDKYELPLVVADSVSELARVVGVAPVTISSAICHSKQRRGRSIYKKVRIMEEE